MCRVVYDRMKDLTIWNCHSRTEHCRDVEEYVKSEDQEVLLACTLWD